MYERGNPYGEKSLEVVKQVLGAWPLVCGIFSGLYDVAPPEQLEVLPLCVGKDQRAASPDELEPSRHEQHVAHWVVESPSDLTAAIAPRLRHRVLEGPAVRGRWHYVGVAVGGEEPYVLLALEAPIGEEQQVVEVEQ